MRRGEKEKRELIELVRVMELVYLSKDFEAVKNAAYVAADALFHRCNIHRRPPIQNPVDEICICQHDRRFFMSRPRVVRSANTARTDMNCNDLCQREPDFH